ncbi:MAG TPA: lipocalin-like domain-containing protein [Thermoanaerobaculia bacterium]|nr:lipocalin-like domain-containing protein [Thermoanaerobaculia bacterium]
MIALVLLIAFQPALPGYQFEFPRDHGTHDSYKTEWWYYTGHLRTDDGHRYGFELTFFRVGLDTEEKTNPWELRQLALAHFAISDIDGRDFRYYEKLNRVSPFTANEAEGKLDLFNEGWRATTLPDGSWRIVARGDKDAIDLVLRTRKPPAIHGENGVSVKAAGIGGSASHYYSMTRLEASGAIDGRKCNGLVWMDHEFGSSQLRENQRGWDWFSIQLDDETELMLYIIRLADGTPDITSSGSFIAKDGTVTHLRRDQLAVRATGSWRSAKSRAKYPMGWEVDVPDHHLVLTPLLNDQELLTKGSAGVTYWEGAVSVSGTAKGEGYVEMTGYQTAFRAP